MIALAVASAPTSAIEWWYPVAVWGLVLAAVARVVQSAIASVVPRAATPRWLPLACGAVALLPVAGLPIGRWLHGFNACFSIPFAALLLDSVLSPLLRRPLLAPSAQRAAVWFGVIAGWLLYPAALGLGSFDPYVLGWRSPGVAAAAAVIGVGLALRNNGFGFVLLVAGLLWHLRCLESDNAWDYLVDPIYWALATVNLVAGQAARLLPRWPARRGAAAICLAYLAGGGTPEIAAAPEQPRPLKQLDETWASAAAALERRAKHLGQEQLAEYIRAWPLPSIPDRQLVLDIPPSLTAPAWIDTAEEQEIWKDFCTAR